MADLSLCFIWWARAGSSRGPKDYEFVRVAINPHQEGQGVGG